MKPKHLLHPPLVEAIFEFRWGSEDGAQAVPGVLVDPDYQILLGLFFGKVKGHYGHHTAKAGISEIPPEMVPYQVQHQFRVTPDGWPLLQLGPGVMAVNVVRNGYSWSDFKTRIEQAVEWLWEVHPSPEQVRPAELILRYINSFSFDHVTDDACRFLETNLGIQVSVAKEVLTSSTAKPSLQGLDINLSYLLPELSCPMQVRYATGEREGQPAVICELVVSKKFPEASDVKDVSQWVTPAHDAIENWFFASLRGDARKAVCDHDACQ